MSILHFGMVVVSIFDAFWVNFFEPFSGIDFASTCYSSFMKFQLARRKSLGCFRRYHSRRAGEKLQEPSPSGNFSAHGWVQDTVPVVEQHSSAPLDENFRMQNRSRNIDLWHDAGPPDFVENQQRVAVINFSSANRDK